MTKTNNKKLNQRVGAIMLILCMALFTVLAAIPVHAVTPASGQAAFEIKNFRYEAVVTKSHQYNVSEKITVNLTDDLTELEFALPNGNYNLGDLELDGIPYRNSGNTVKIDDLEKLKKGHHTYNIEYIIREYQDKDTNKDILYFDILPPSWMQAITNLNISVQFPEDFPLDDIQYYAGQYGVQNVDTKLNYTVRHYSKSLNITGERIPENFGITLKAGLIDGYWEGALSGALPRLLMIFLMLVLIVALAAMWYIGGRDPQFEKIIQSHPVDGITPAEVSYVINGRVRTRDVVSLIVYFATRGYLKISEYEPKRYRLVRVKDPNPTDEEKYIRTAYELLFEDIPLNRWVDMNDMGPRLRRIEESIKEDVAAGFSSKDMLSFTTISKAFRTIGTLLTALFVGVCSILRYSSIFESPNYVEAGFMAAITGVLLYYITNTYDEESYSEGEKYSFKLMGLCAGYVATAIYFVVRTIMITGYVLSAIIPALLMIAAAFLLLIMRARATGNAELANKFMQLRHFIYHPDAKVMLEAFMADRNYYYEIAPYALTFNGLETWAISFLTLNVPDPDWYEEDIEGHAITNLIGEEKTVIDYARDIKAFARTIENAYQSMGRQGRIKWQINKK